MKKYIITSLAAVALATGCMGPMNNTERGAAQGALGGAILGGIIGPLEAPYTGSITDGVFTGDLEETTLDAFFGVYSVTVSGSFTLTLDEDSDTGG